MFLERSPMKKHAMTATIPNGVAMMYTTLTESAMACLTPAAAAARITGVTLGIFDNAALSLLRNAGVNFAQDAAGSPAPKAASATC